jgi:hypothetical protein
MNAFHFRRVLDTLAGMEPVMVIFWLGLLFFTAGLAVLMYTRWGQYRPLRKCMGLSLLAHLMLASYAATIHIAAPLAQPAEQSIRVSIGDGPVEKAAGGGASPTGDAVGQPWEVFPDDEAAQPKEIGLERGKSDPLAEPKRLVRAEDARLPGEPSLDRIALADAKPLTPTTAAVRAARESSPLKPAEPIEAPAAQHREAAPPAIPNAAAETDRLASDNPGRPVRMSSDDTPQSLLEQFAPLPAMTDNDSVEPPMALDRVATAPLRIKPAPRIATNVDGLTGGSDAAGGAPASGPSLDGGGGEHPDGGENGAGSAEVTLAGVPRGLVGKSVPDAYRLRVAPNRSDVAQSRGGTAATEAAVKAALKWLADNQDANGRWNPRTHAAGKETNVLGRDRQHAGSHSDSAMTGLALLAFLASGHTHFDGPYHDDVRRGLEYLMRTQAADGNLAGEAAPFEFMYCHAMAACALSEAYGMTHDARLSGPVRKAVNYTLRAQDPVGGGWRYKPGDAGDTSQMGWQLMTLKSAELAGIPIPDSTRQGIIRYLQSVASGSYGGRAAYRPSEQPSRTMTAEALVCWQFLGLSRQNPACNEAGDFLLAELPSEANSNLYYWYYATLAMYQLQGVHWQRWNDALREAVVSRQVKAGPQAGSWDTDDLWGGHGGRVYTTSLATLTLEVYYRFLPLYAEVAPDDGAK